MKQAIRHGSRDGTRDGSELDTLAGQAFSRDPIKTALEELNMDCGRCKDFDSATQACERTRALWLSFSDQWAINPAACRSMATTVISAMEASVKAVETVWRDLQKSNEKAAKTLGKFKGNISKRIMLIRELTEKGDKALFAHLRHQR